MFNCIIQENYAVTKREKMPHLVETLKISQDRTAFVRESECILDHTSGSRIFFFFFLQNWFEQTYVMKGEPAGLLPADSLSWISASVLSC